MQSLSLRNRILVGLTLFSMFFGAGNLIFPPYLGFNAGTSTLVAMFGFAATAVLAPILGVIATALNGGLAQLASYVSKGFAFVMTFLIYLSIGPLLAIPRTASTSFEMVGMPFFHGDGAITGTLFGFPIFQVVQALYSIIFFSVAFSVALNPEKLTQFLGKILSPTLLTLIGVLFIGVLFHPIGDGAPATGFYATRSFVQGFLDGYQTMDTLAGLLYGIVIAMNIRNLGAKSTASVLRETIFAGIIAAILLIVVYGILSFIGMQTSGTPLGGDNGAQTLNRVAHVVFGPWGQVVLGVIFFVACLNTCVGLLACCANYFKGLVPSLGYRGWLAILVFVSMVFSNLGLTYILKFSIPVLLAIYPICLVLVFLGLVHQLIKRAPLVYPLTIGLTSIISVLEAINYTKLLPHEIADILASLPFADLSLSWLPFAAVGLVLGLMTGCFKGCKGSCER